jgi:hypothetical protein
MHTNARLIDELNDVTLWQSPPTLLLAQQEPTLLRSLADAQSAAALTQTDKAVGHRYGTDLSALPALGSDLQVFGQWPSVASTIYNKLIRMTGFDPSNVDFNSAAFSAFRTKFSTSPFWNGLEFNILYRDAALRIRDYRQAVDAIIDLLSVGISTNIVRSIISNIRQIAQLASRNVRTQQKQTIFQNGSLCVTNGKLYVFFLYTNVEMTARQGKYTVIDQTSRIVRGYGVLDFDFCIRHANSILRYDKKAVDDWEGDAEANDQPPNESEGWPPGP